MTGHSGTDIKAAFASREQAEATAAELREAGFPATAIDLQVDVLQEARAREARFLWRVLVIIVLWSIAGGVIGAGFGWLLAETIGPEGTAGLVLQLVSWIILGHLIVGMLAGYFVLADRTDPEMPPDRPVSVLTIRDLGPGEVRRVRRLLRSRDAIDVRISA